MKPTNPGVQSHRARINAALRKEARSQGTAVAAVNDLRKQYIFTLFLRRIFSSADGKWLLLGGNALMLRTGGGRYTQDIDLAREEPFHDSQTVQQELQQLVDREVSEDLFRFDIHQVEMRSQHVDDYGYGTPAARASVVAYLGVQEFERFSLDIVQQHHLQTPGEWLPLRPVIKDETLENLPQVLVTPLESHLADKICAMYEQYRGGASTRMRDLADIVRIVQQLSFNAATLQEKLSHEQLRRKMTLPPSFQSPGQNWHTDFPKTAKTFNGYPTELHTLEASLNYAGRCLTPVLSGMRTNGTWEPELGQWS